MFITRLTFRNKKISLIVYYLSSKALRRNNHRRMGLSSHLSDKINNPEAAKQNLEFAKRLYQLCGCPTNGVRWTGVLPVRPNNIQEEPLEKTTQEVKGGRARKVRRIKGGGGKPLNTVKVKEFLKENGVPEDRIDKFVTSKKQRGWNASSQRVWNAYEDWAAKQGFDGPEEKEHKEEKKEEKKEKTKEEHVHRTKFDGPEEKKKKKGRKPKVPIAPPPPPVAPPAAVGPKRTAFKLTEKEFINITHSKPIIEWKNILKDFFNEMNISDYSRVPGDFVSAVNALQLVSHSDEQKIASLKSLIQSFRPVVVPEKAAEPKVKKLVQPKTSSSVKKSTGKTGRARQVGKPRSVNELPKPRGIKPHKKRVKHTISSSKGLRRTKTHNNEIHLIL